MMGISKSYVWISGKCLYYYSMSNGYLVAYRDLPLESVDTGYIEYPANTADSIRFGPSRFGSSP